MLWEAKLAKDHRFIAWYISFFNLIWCSLDVKIMFFWMVRGGGGGGGRVFRIKKDHSMLWSIRCRRVALEESEDTGRDHRIEVWLVVKGCGALRRGCGMNCSHRQHSWNV